VIIYNIYLKRGYEMIEKKFKSVFDVPVKGVDGTENFLEQFRGKILLFVNTTGQCGNSRQ
jgi:glutathione peroxidase-family protein